MFSTCVVNVAVGSWFPAGQERLRKSLEGYPVDFMGWTNRYPPGCEPHNDRPYEFKRAAMLWAEKQGYNVAIWADASCWFVKNPELLIKTIERQRYWFCTLGWDVGTWCSDAALPGTGHSRAELFRMQMVAATFYGLAFDNGNICDRYFKYMLEKQEYFKGPYRNDHHEASDDPRVKGHRHDQTFLSIFAHENGLVIDKPPCFFDYATQTSPGDADSAVAPHNEAVAIAQGM